MAVWGEKNINKERRGGNKKTNNRMVTIVKHSKFFTCINSFKKASRKRWKINLFS